MQSATKGNKISAEHIKSAPNTLTEKDKLKT